MGIENRQEPRLSGINWPVDIRTERGHVGGEIKNISEGGIYLRCKGLLPKKETLSMAIKPPAHSPLQVAVQPVWAEVYTPPYEENTPIGFGARFTEISDEDREFISVIVSTQLHS